MEVMTAGLSVAPQDGLHIVVTTVASDAHTWNLVYLQLLLEEGGHRVANLGPCVPDELLVAECLRLRPDLVVISSVNGHGARDGMQAIKALRARAELSATPVVIGGKLGIDGARQTAHTGPLLAAGFDAVFEDGAGIASFQAFLARIPVPARA
jgi:methylaspartate mutase sigma subunit